MQVKTTLHVQDQDRALDFYVNTLGFEKRRDLPYEQSGFRWIEVSVPGTRTTLVFGRKSEDEPQQSGQLSLVLETDNIQEMYETWRAIAASPLPILPRRNPGERRQSSAIQRGICWCLFKRSGPAPPW